MSPDYAMMRQLLRSSLPGISPAMLHGLISGLLSSGAPDIDADDVATALDEELADVVVKLVDQLVQLTREQLAQSDYTFQLLLPNDDERMKARVIALGEWCEAFTTGFSAGFAQPESVLGTEGRESLTDIGQLAGLLDSASETDEDEEADFMELVEYVRMAAAALYQQLVAAGDEGAGDASDSQSPHVLH